MQISDQIKKKKPSRLPAGINKCSKEKLCPAHPQLCNQNIEIIPSRKFFLGKKQVLQGAVVAQQISVKKDGWTNQVEESRAKKD